MSETTLTIASVNGIGNANHNTLLRLTRRSSTLTRYGKCDLNSSVGISIQMYTPLLLLIIHNPTPRPPRINILTTRN